eukprot:9433963-Alexandrium_andersonii.AAC.1
MEEHFAREVEGKLGGGPQDLREVKLLKYPVGQGWAEVRGRPAPCQAASVGPAGARQGREA